MENKHEIHSRIYQFVLLVLEVLKYIPKTLENSVLVKQVVRSAGSIGANATEADGAESRKEFIYKFTISKKEAKETWYWLSLISDHNPQLRDKIKPLLEENRQIVAIVSKIILNSAKKIEI